MKKIFLVALFVISISSFLKAQSLSNDTIEILTFAEQMPEFPGGDTARINFFQNNINYPEIAWVSKIEAKVQIQFVVQKDGKISDVKALTHKGWGLEDEAIRAIKIMPPWIPGKQNGKPVNLQISLPILFMLPRK
jgi:protein TonB